MVRVKVTRDCESRDDSFSVPAFFSSLTTEVRPGGEPLPVVVPCRWVIVKPGSGTVLSVSSVSPGVFASLVFLCRGCFGKVVSEGYTEEWLW